MNKIYFAFLTCFAFIACDNSDNPKDPSNIAGGPCTFDTTIKPIIIKGMTTSDSMTYRVFFQFPFSKDSFDHFIEAAKFFREYKTEITSIKAGDTVQYLDLRTIGGSCAGKPEVHFEKYKANAH